MFRYVMLVLTMLLLPLFTGCTANYLWGGLYGGIKARNDLQSTPSERLGQPESPDYSEYERLRREQR